MLLKPNHLQFHGAPKFGEEVAFGGWSSGKLTLTSALRVGTISATLSHPPSNQAVSSGGVHGLPPLSASHLLTKLPETTPRNETHMVASLRWHDSEQGDSRVMGAQNGAVGHLLPIANQQAMPAPLRFSAEANTSEISVVKNDSLIKLARRHGGISPAELAAFNGLDPNRLNHLRVGAVLKVPSLDDVNSLRHSGVIDKYLKGLERADREYQAQRVATRKITNQLASSKKKQEKNVEVNVGEIFVRKNDSLIKLARRHGGISPVELAAFNNLDPNRLNRLRVGAVLQVPSSDDIDSLRRSGVIDNYLKGLERADREYQAQKERERRKAHRLVPIEKIEKPKPRFTVDFWRDWARYESEVKKARKKIENEMTHVQVQGLKARSPAAQRIFDASKNVFYWGKAALGVASRMAENVGTVVWTLAGAYGDTWRLAARGIPGPASDITAVADTVENVARGVKVLTTDFTGTVTRSGMALAQDWQDAQVLRAQGKIEEAAAREVDLLANVGLAVIPAYYGFKTIGGLATWGAEVSGVEKVLRMPRELLHQTAAKVNDVVVRNPYSIKVINTVGNRIEDFANKSKYIPERLKPKSRPAGRGAASAENVSLRGGPPGPWTKVRRGALAVGGAETVYQISKNEPIKVYVSNAETVGSDGVYPMHFVRWNASPAANARIYQVGDLFHVMEWCIPLDARPPWLSGADVTSLWYVRKNASGYSIADAPRVGGECAISFSFGDNNVWVGAQAIARPMNATSPTQVNVDTKSGFNIKNITSQTSINPLYVTVQSHFSFIWTQLVLRDVNANGVASWQYPAAVGDKVFTLKNKNVPVDLFALMPNPGFGETNLGNEYIPNFLIYPADILPNLLSGRPISREALRPILLQDSSLAKVIKDGKLVPLSDDLKIVLDEQGRARAVTVPELHKHYSGEFLSNMGYPALLLKRAGVDLKTLDRSKVVVVDDQGRVRNLKSTEMLTTHENGGVLAVEEGQLGYSARGGYSVYVSDLPFGELTQLPSESP